MSLTLFGVVTAVHGLGRAAPRLSTSATEFLARSGSVSAAQRPKAKQSLGQNFLQDRAIARSIADAVPAVGEGGRRVIELGPGQGALTGWLLARHPEMTAVELDARMIEVLRAELPALNVLEADMLHLDLARLSAERGGRLALVSNTPFYLTSPLLFKLLGSLEHVESAVLTTQLEVREKLTARPGTKQYGILSVMLQTFCQPKHLFDIEAAAFSPAPKVDSSVLRFTPSATPAGRSAPMSPARRADLLALLKLTFESRRKMLRTSLKPLLLGEQYVDRPTDATLAQRPEQLEPAAWLELAETLFGASEGAEAGGAGALLAGAHPSKGWQPHKAGYIDNAGRGKVK